MDFEAVSTLGVPGWVELRLRGDDSPRVLAKFEERAGRGVVTRLVLIGDGLDSSTLRAIPIGRVESALHHPQLGFAAGITKPLDPDVLREMAERGELSPDEIGDIDRGIEGFLAREPNPVPGVKLTYRQTPREPLTRPDGADPDGFSRQVALAYNSAVLEGRAPAKILADEAGVPVTTVHRWIREARQRGHLPPARKGRAG